MWAYCTTISRSTPWFGWPIAVSQLMVPLESYWLPPMEHSLLPMEIPLFSGLSRRKRKLLIQYCNYWILNFVVTSDNDFNNFAWQSFDYLTDTLVPGMKLDWNLTSGFNRNLTAWSSATDPSPGNYTLAMDLRGDPQFIFWAGSAWKIRSDPWTGVDFSGMVPYNPSYSTTFAFNFVNNKEEIYYIANVVNSTLTRLVLNQSGILQQFVWLSSGQRVLYWYTPRSQCDSYVACGPHGALCYLDGLTMLSCFPGFSPKFVANWALRD